MRKNYFAKKFVAYSMAFAVAFSTLTVSPVFVKEAKAADVSLRVVNAEKQNVTVEDGIGFINKVSSSLAASTVDLSEVAGQAGMTDKMFDVISAKADTPFNNGDAEVKGKYTSLTLKGASQDGTTAADGLLDGGAASSAGTVATTPVPVVIGDEDEGKASPDFGSQATWYKLSLVEGTYDRTTASTTEKITYSYYLVKQTNFVNKNKLDLGTVDENELGLYLAVGTAANSGYKLYNVYEKTTLKAESERATYLAKNGDSCKMVIKATSNKPNLTYQWVFGTKVLDEKSNVLTIDKVDNQSTGYYSCTVSDGVMSKKVANIEVKESSYSDYNAISQIQYTSVVKAVNPAHTPTETTDNKLANGKLSLTSCVPANDDYVFLWFDGTTDTVTDRVERSEADTIAYDATKNTVTITDTKNTYNGKKIYCYVVSKYDYEQAFKANKELDAVKNATTDVAKYKAVDTLLNAEATAPLKAKAISVETFWLLPTTDKIHTSENVVKSVGDSISLNAPSVTLKTGEKALYRDDNAENKSTAGVLLEGHDTNDEISTFTKTAIDATEFGAKRFVVATDANSTSYNNQNGKTFIEGLDYYTRSAITTYKLADDNDNGTTDGKVTSSYFDSNKGNLFVKNGDNYDVQTSGTWAVDTVYYVVDSVTYKYTLAKGLTKSTFDDAKSSYYVKQFNIVAEKFVNVVYTPDLEVSANNVTAKIGEEVQLAVTATSKLPLDYTWTSDIASKSSVPTKGSTKDATKSDKFTVQAGDIYQPVEYKEDGVTEKTPEANYVECTVTNGIETKVVKITISQQGGFSYVGSDGKTYASTKNTATDFDVNGIKDKEVTLAPVVKANEGTELTYKWYKTPGEVLGTDATFTTKYVNNDKFYVVIADKAAENNKVVLSYTVKDTTLTSKNIAIDKIDAQVYTGKAIEPAIRVVAVDPNGKPFVGQLVKDTDYTVTFENNINAGTARVIVTLSKDLDATQTAKAEATFPIDRANNELKVADKTVVLGGNVQPKTTNKAGAAVTYTYYADADCTTEIDVPSKVGTYYVKANAIATVNYNEATSNVATVKVVPGKVKMLGTSRTASSVKLNWTKATGATSYRVYYKAPGAKSYKVFKNTTATSMNVTGLASATTYTFAVKAYAKTAGYSTVYATKKTTTAPAKVATPSVTAGSKNATVKFTKVARATGYQIYMAKGNGKYVKVKTTTSTSFTKTRLAKGATYKFKVRAYKTVGSNTYYGAFSSAKAVKVK